MRETDRASMLWSHVNVYAPPCNCQCRNSKHAQDYGRIGRMYGAGSCCILVLSHRLIGELHLNLTLEYQWLKALAKDPGNLKARRSALQVKRKASSGAACSFTRGSRRRTLWRWHLCCSSWLRCYMSMGACRRQRSSPAEHWPSGSAFWEPSTPTSRQPFWVRARYTITSLPVPQPPPVPSQPGGAQNQPLLNLCSLLPCIHVHFCERFLEVVLYMCIVTLHRRPRNRDPEGWPPGGS